MRLLEAIIQKFCDKSCSEAVPVTEEYQKKIT